MPADPTYFQGATGGLSGLATGLQIGAGKMYEDISGLARLGMGLHANEATPITPAAGLYHGMAAHEMSFMDAANAMSGYNLPFGSGVPSNMTSYEWGSAAAEHLGSGVGRSVAIGGFYGAGAFGTLGAMRFAPKMGTVWGAGRAMGARGAAAMGLRAGGMAAGGVGLLGGAAAFGAAFMLPFMTADSFLEDVITGVEERNEIMDYIRMAGFRQKPGGYQMSERRDIAEWMLNRGGIPGSGMGGFGRGLNRMGGMFGMPSMSPMSGVSGADPDFSLGELKGILQEGTQLGLLSGVEDVSDFKRKFTDLTKNLGMITKVLHQSLSDGLKTIKVLKDMGYSTPEGQMGAVLQSSIMGVGAGMTPGEMLTTGVQGASMMRGTGIDFSAGAEANQMAMFAIKAMQGTGAITAQDITHAGGVNAMAARMTGDAMNFAQSPIGRGLLFGMSPGGRLDTTQLNQFMSGQADLFDVVGKATKRLDDPGAYMNFTVNQAQNIGDMMKSAGGMGGTLGQLSLAMKESQFYAEQYNVDPRLALQYTLKTRFNMSDADIKQRMGMLDNTEELRKNQLRGVAGEASRLLYEEQVKDMRIGAVAGRAWDAIDITTPLSIGLGRMADSIGEAVGDFWLQDVVGLRKPIRISEDAADLDLRFKDIIREQKGGKAARWRNRRIYERDSYEQTSIMGEDEGEAMIRAAREGLGVKGKSGLPAVIDIAWADINDANDGLTPEQRKNYVLADESAYGDKTYLSREHISANRKAAQDIAIGVGDLAGAASGSRFKRKMKDDASFRSRLANVSDSIGGFSELAGLLVPGHGSQEYGTYVRREARDAGKKVDALALSDFTPEGQVLLAGIAGTVGGQAYIQDHMGLGAAFSGLGPLEVLEKKAKDLEDDLDPMLTRLGRSIAAKVMPYDKGGGFNWLPSIFEGERRSALGDALTSKLKDLYKKPEFQDAAVELARLGPGGDKARIGELKQELRGLFGNDINGDAREALLRRMQEGGKDSLSAYIQDYALYQRERRRAGREVIDDTAMKAMAGQLENLEAPQETQEAVQRLGAFARGEISELGSDERSGLVKDLVVGKGAKVQKFVHPLYQSLAIIKEVTALADRAGDSDPVEATKAILKKRGFKVSDDTLQDLLKSTEGNVRGFAQKLGQGLLGQSLSRASGAEGLASAELSAPGLEKMTEFGQVLQKQIIEINDLIITMEALAFKLGRRVGEVK